MKYQSLVTYSVLLLFLIGGLTPVSLYAQVCTGLDPESGERQCIGEATGETRDITEWCPDVIDLDGFTDMVIEDDDTCALWEKRQDGPTPVDEIILESVPLPNPLGAGNVNIELILGRAIQTVMGILGAITLFVFVDGAWNWITSAGFPQRVQQGIRTMLFAVAGLFVIFAAYGILSSFINALTLG